MSKEVTVTLVKSTIGSNDKQKANVKGLGLKKIGQTKTLVDTPEVRGMINKVSHLVKVMA
ncbi:MAG: 50S ribosomal protein L30 [SAR324 cluster bacterium]|nr:50S ribosomal protein L30 [SAR324 cluster bacterium]